MTEKELLSMCLTISTIEGSLKGIATAMGYLDEEEFEEVQPKLLETLGKNSEVLHSVREDILKALESSERECVKKNFTPV